MKQNENVLSQWSQSAPYWEKHRETIRGMFAPITQALIHDAQIEAGHSVLDVATGPGEPALSIAEVVGTNGSIVGVDPVAEMVAAADRAARRLHLSNVRFEIASADTLPFPAGHFDAAVSRFGVMFFPAPVDGIREMLRVVKQGRKLAFAVWHFAERNPFHSVISRVVERYVQSAPAPADSPDAFRFASLGKLLQALNAAGAIESFERLLEFNIEAPLAVEDFWTLRSQMSDKLRTKLSMLSNEDGAAVRREVIQNLRAYSTSRGMSFPAEVLIVGGTKP